ncbi:MAG: hypothetical protein L7T19_01925 [Pseudomonadales bacterium]|nr:hypothetical protein [Pseudomonadales bacterium]
MARRQGHLRLRVTCILRAMSGNAIVLKMTQDEVARGWIERPVLKGFVRA